MRAEAVARLVDDRPEEGVFRVHRDVFRTADSLSPAPLYPDARRLVALETLTISGAYAHAIACTDCVDRCIEDSDAVTPTCVSAPGVDPLVRQWGTEVGARTELVENVTSSVSLWHLESQSELIYVGDAGTNEAGPATERYGVEWAVYWNPNDWLKFDSELAVSEARFRNEPVDRFVENAVPIAFSGGITAGKATGPYGSLRARYFSERPLTADESVMSRESLVFNARAGFRQEKWDVYVELLNLFDSDANDIEYFYESQLQGEAGPVEDTHYHPMEPFTVRTGVAVHW